MTEPTGTHRLSTADMAAARQQAAEPAGPQASGNGDSRRSQPAGAPGGAADGKAMPLLNEAEAGSMRSRWALIQAGFVDEPRSAVEQGDALVAELMQRLAEVFAAERARLEEQWSQGTDVSTEDLRLALRRYRSFFDRLLTL
jgi:hypothetical protein